MRAFIRQQRVVLSVFSVALLAGLVAQAASAETLIVGTCKTGSQFHTIRQAIAAATPGSTIYICPGTYGEQLLITENLTLIGVSANGLAGATAAGANNPVITPPSAGGLDSNASDLYDDSPIAAQIAVVTPSGASTPIKVSLSSIAVDGANNQIAGCGPDLVGIYYQNASGTINHVVTRNQMLATDLGGCQSGLAIYVESGYTSGGTAVVTIENSSVHNYQKNGITVDGSGTVATITGNYVVGQGATPVIAQNGIQVSDGANGKVSGNTVTDDVYVNPSDCSTASPPDCVGSAGILVYDSGATSSSPLTISGNTVSNTQLAIVAFGDSSGTADYNAVTSNKVTGTQAASIYLDDGIDLCSNNNTATSNNVFNSSGSGIHIDSTCTESTGSTGNNTTVTHNIINEACAGVLTGSGTGSSQSSNTFYNVLQTTQAGDSCPAGAPNSYALGQASSVRTRRKPQPLRP